MNIHEYQAKGIPRKNGINIPGGFPCYSPDAAADAAAKLGGDVWVVKAQIDAGGRGKGGGVRPARSIAEVRQHAGEILGMTLKTHRTGPTGRVVKRRLVEQGADIAQELHLGMVVDRTTQHVALIASGEGGMDIEEVAARTPEKFHKLSVDQVGGLTAAQADDVARKIGVPGSSIARPREFMHNLYGAFDGCDASLAGIDPVVVTRDGRAIAMDARFDDDPDTAASIIAGETGGEANQTCARRVKEHIPVAGFIAGVIAPPGKRMGHAGAIISGGKGAAGEKLAVMQECGIRVTRTPAELLGRLLAPPVQPSDHQLA